MDDATRANRRAWDAASSKYVREHSETLAAASSGSSLLDTERELLREVLKASPRVVHLQSGNGTDDVALVRAGAAPLATAIADLVDTGKGALIWMPDLARWAQDAAPLWSWDADEPRIRADRSYSFALLARRTTVVERVPEDRERAS